MLKIIKNVKQQSRFSLLYKIIESKNVKIVSDESNYIIAQSDENMPVWVWNKEDISDIKIKEIIEKLEEFIARSGEIKVTASEEIYNAIQGRNNYFVDNYFEMGSYYCKNTIEPRKSEGRLDFANLEDLETISKYRIDELKELENIDGNYDEIYKKSKKLIESGDFYVWRNNDNKVVCTAVINNSGQFSRINKVYTPVEDRCKGYAKNIIFELTNKALNEGYIPVLYTDYNYPASNKAYTAVGYEDLGKLINFSLKRKD